MVTMQGEWATFRFIHGAAGAVCVVGDFNGWEIGGSPMRRIGRTCWEARVRLPKGTFKFKYWADGEWFTDYAAFGVEPGLHGHDSIIWVHDPSRKGEPQRRSDMHQAVHP
jgi:1,4-alpha-glucan branching enzyme